MKIRGILLAFWVGSACAAWGEEQVKPQPAEDEAPVLERAEGLFEVASIRNETGFFKVVFRGVDEKNKDKNFSLWNF